MQRLWPDLSTVWSHGSGFPWEKELHNWLENCALCINVSGVTTL